MSKALLEIQNLHVRVEEKEILHGVDLAVGQDETHVLMGPNGTGKSTLGYAITGNPTYSVTSGSIIFNGEDITELPVNERAKKGIFLSFQNPLEVPGVTLSAFIRSALEQKTGDRLRLWDFKKKLKETMGLLNMDESYAERDLNVGFSGGEKKKAEILQMLMLEPKLAILDETDSGLDVDAVRTVSEGVRLFRERTHGSLLIITHSTRILEALHVEMPDHFLIDDSAVLPPAPADEADAVEVLRGPNIQPFPQSRPFADTLTAELVLKVGDNITTDHIMPAGAKILPYRSNIPKLAEFCFTVCDPTFPARAKAAGDGIIVGGSNYGQGSSREHAALVPMYLGIRCVVAKSFARIFYRNSINIGLPIMECPEAVDAIEAGDTVQVDFDTGVITDETNGKVFYAEPFPPFIQTIISAGGGAQEAVELKTVSPQYLGAVVVCDGADSPQVQLAVTQAVAQFTGLSTDHISVLRKQPDPQSK